MKTLVIAAGFTAAVNSSMIWGGHLLGAFQGPSEPVGLAVWGVALFVIAASLKRRSAAPHLQEHRSSESNTVTPGLPPFRAFASEPRA